MDQLLCTTIAAETGFIVETAPSNGHDFCRNALLAEHHEKTLQKEEQRHLETGAWRYEAHMAFRLRGNYLSVLTSKISVID